MNNNYIEGKVKWWNTEKGYGFIVTPDQKEYFVHYNDILFDGFKDLNSGDIVNFVPIVKLVKNEEKLVAINVSIVSKAIPGNRD